MKTFDEELELICGFLRIKPEYHAEKELKQLFKKRMLEIVPEEIEPEPDPESEDVNHDYVSGFNSALDRCREKIEAL